MKCELFITIIKPNISPKNNKSFYLICIALEYPIVNYCLMLFFEVILKSITAIKCIYLVQFKNDREVL
jgi:hypothetical protein